MSQPGLTAPASAGSLARTLGITFNTPLAAASILRYLWASPATLLGLLATLPLLPLGAKAVARSGVLEVTLGSSSGRFAPNSLPFVAITLGHVVIAANASYQDSWRTHELVHVAQYERWGPFFLLAYPAESLLQFFRGYRPYLDNRFEVEARLLSEAKTFAPLRGDA